MGRPRKALVEDMVMAQETMEATEQASKTKTNELVTVLFGYGKVPVGKVTYVDRVKFTDGVARNVPLEVAENWKNGTHSETKQPYATEGSKQSYGRLDVIILPQDATEADFAKATGIKPMVASKFAALLKAYPVTEIVEALGEERSLQLANELRKAIKAE